MLNLNPSGLLSQENKDALFKAKGSNMEQILYGHKITRR